MNWTKLIKSSENMPVSEEADLFARRYDEASEIMLNKQREIGSEYGTIGLKITTEEEKIFDKIENIFEDYGLLHDDTDEAYDQLPKDKQNEVMNLVLKILNNN